MGRRFPQVARLQSVEVVSTVSRLSGILTDVMVAQMTPPHAFIHAISGLDMFTPLEHRPN